MTTATISSVCFCERCKQNVTFHYDPTNHVMHLIITILTGGLWLPIWMLLTWAPSRVKTKICDRCGEPLWGK